MGVVSPSHFLPHEDGVSPHYGGLCLRLLFPFLFLFYRRGKREITGFSPNFDIFKKMVALYNVKLFRISEAIIYLKKVKIWYNSSASFNLFSLYFLIEEWIIFWIILVEVLVTILKLQYQNKNNLRQGLCKKSFKGHLGPGIRVLGPSKTYS